MFAKEGEVEVDGASLCLEAFRVPWSCCGCASFCGRETFEPGDIGALVIQAGCRPPRNIFNVSLEEEI